MTQITYKTSSSEECREVEEIMKKFPLEVHREDYLDIEVTRRGYSTLLHNRENPRDCGAGDRDFIEARIKRAQSNMGFVVPRIKDFSGEVYFIHESGFHKLILITQDKKYGLAIFYNPEERD